MQLEQAMSKYLSVLAFLYGILAAMVFGPATVPGTPEQHTRMPSIEEQPA